MSKDVRLAQMIGILACSSLSNIHSNIISFRVVFSYILIACDGLWKCFTVAEALQFVSNCLKDEKVSPTQPSQSLWECRWQSAAGRLAAEAVRRGSGDNVTVVIVAIGDTIENFDLVL